MELDRGSDPFRRKSLFRREAISLAEIGVPTFSVVLGILLALAIDDWSKVRETRESVAAAMSARETIAKAYGLQRACLDERAHVFESVLRAQPTPVANCAGIVRELMNLDDSTENAATKAIEAAGA